MLRLGVALTLLVCVLAQESGGSSTEYKSCEYPNDCTDPERPLCMTFFQDFSFARNRKPRPFKTHGVCVQCQSDCDCPANMYCGKDFTIPEMESTNPEIDAFSQRMIKWAGLSVAGTKMRTKCMHFTETLTPTVGSECASVDLIDAWNEKFLYYNTHPSGEESQAVHRDGVRVTPMLARGFARTVVRSSGVVANSSENLFCGLVSEYIPFTVPQVGAEVQQSEDAGLSAIDYTVSRGPMTPGQCFKTVYVNDYSGRSLATRARPTVKILGGCGQHISTNDARFAILKEAGFAVETSEPAFQGHCQGGVCQVCSEGQSRCTEGRGAPQTCVGGKWVKINTNDWTYRTLTQNSIAGSYLVGAIVTVAIAILVVVALFKLR